MKQKRILLNSIIVTAIMTLSGCSTIDSTVTGNDVDSNSDVVVIQKGASLQTATNYIAQVYKMKNVHWDRKINRSNYKLMDDVTFSRHQNAQAALNAVFGVLPDLIATANPISDNVDVTLNNFAGVTARFADKTGYDVLSVDTSNISIKKKYKITILNYNKSSLFQESPLDNSIVSRNNQKGSLMTGEESLQSTPKVNVHHHIITTERGSMLSNTVINQLSNFGYNAIWMINDHVAEQLHTPAKREMTFNADSVNQFVDSIASELSQLSGHTVNVKVFPDSKQVVFHLYDKGNVALFNLEEGKLSTNINNLAKQFGWTLSKDHGWLAKEDYPINVAYPVVAENNMNAVLTKLIEPYKGKIHQQLLESTKQIFIVDAK
ncbi:hypothetical protein C9J21_18525 [Photobacterium phosphoreum]|uniref:hypothetical protein n=1 Tax=Photobacterium phosphoreum TaxID=659 RepID=UPI000D15BD7E|nr:hypothetical protein [Photobacterium phosphoreum]PSW30801.1 hypothetical protein C9J21_18525 [Photobacterium phosphoreum]